MPAYNAEKYIEKAVQSVLNQSFHDLELIIVDDASKDNTFTIMKKLKRSDKRIRIYKNKENLQIAKTLNKCLILSKADMVARMDADDYALPTRIKDQYDYLNRHKKVAVVGANIDVVDETGEKLFVRTYPTSSKDLKGVLFRYSPFAHPVVMYRKSIVLENKGYSYGIYPCEDLDLWFRIGSKNDLGSINKTLLEYTFFKNSSSHNNLKEVELLTFKIRLNAILKLGYRPSLYDAIYNILQYLTLWFIPPRLRIKMYNSLRSKNVI